MGGRERGQARHVQGLRGEPGWPKGSGLQGTGTDTVVSHPLLLFSAYVYFNIYFFLIIKVAHAYLKKFGNREKRIKK